MASFIFLWSPNNENCKPLALVFMAKLRIKSVLPLMAKLFIAFAKLKLTGCTFVDLLILRPSTSEKWKQNICLALHHIPMSWYLVFQTNPSAWRYNTFANCQKAANKGFFCCSFWMFFISRSFHRLVILVEMCLHLKRLLLPHISASLQPILIQFLPTFPNCSHTSIVLVPIGISWPYLLQRLEVFNTLGHSLCFFLI